jgi:predicted RecB family nuclease
MIGAGRLNPEWEYKVWISESMDDSDKIYKEFMNYIGTGKKLYHWSPAEVTHTLKLSSEIRDWYYENDWIDLCKITTNGVVVKGAFDFKLKTISNALSKLELINVNWPKTGPQNGFEAMVKAIKYYTENGNIEIMNEIRDYNEIDCKSLMSIHQLYILLWTQ